MMSREKLLVGIILITVGLIFFGLGIDDTDHPGLIFGPIMTALGLGLLHV